MRVCLSVCSYSRNVKQQNFVVATHMAPGKVYGRSKWKTFAPKNVDIDYTKFVKNDQQWRLPQ